MVVVVSSDLAADNDALGIVSSVGLRESREVEVDDARIRRPLDKK